MANKDAAIMLESVADRNIKVASISISLEGFSCSVKKQIYFSFCFIHNFVLREIYQIKYMLQFLLQNGTKLLLLAFLHGH